MPQILPTDSLEVVFKKLHTSDKGVNQKQVERLLEEYGKNQIEPVSKKPGWGLLWKQFQSPFVFILLGACGVSILLREWVDSVTIVVILFFNGVISFVQEYHSQKTTAALASIIQTTVQVRRQGKELVVPREDTVLGDIILVKPGTILAADVRWIVADGLTVNESLLTGEALEVTKAVTSNLQNVDQVQGFAGTHIMTGYGEGVVTATGMHSALGKIVQLTTATQRTSAFEQGIKRLSRVMLWLVSVTLLVVFGMNIFLKGTDHLITELLFAIALAVSVIPEALPAVVTITFTKGALLLSSKQVIAKRLSAIEDLGHIQVLCTDKTGTLTENKMRVKRVLSVEPEECLRAALLTAISDGSSFDEAIRLAVSGKFYLPSPQQILWNVPFDPERKRTTVVVRRGTQSVLVTKGAPEVILKLCNKKSTPPKLLQQVEELGTQGFRTLAVATSTQPQEQPGHSYIEEKLQFLGLIAFEDPLKPTAKQAIKEAEHLGVAVKILTGDSPEVARSVALQVSILKSGEKVMTGSEFNSLSSIQKQQAVKEVNVFARVTPEDKYSIIQHLQHETVVGFLGEGINDAPALHLANVGLVVQHASDVARESADIILLDRSLTIIVEGIKQGRIIFANVSKYIRYTMIGNFGNFYAIAGISLLIPFLPMLPVQILLTNLLTDLPLMAVAMDQVHRKEIMHPLVYNVREIAFVGILLGLVSSVFDFIFFAIFRNNSPQTIQTLWLISSVLTELALIYSIRTKHFFLFSGRPHISILILSLLATIVVLGIPYLDFTSQIFHLIQPNWQQLSTIFSLVIAYFVVTEVSKLLVYKNIQGLEITRP